MATASVLWTSFTAAVTLANSGLSNLSNNAITVTSAISASGRRWGLTELYVAYSVTPSAYVTLYLLPSIDGTTFPDFVCGTEPQNLQVAFYPIAASAGTYRLLSPWIQVPPGDFKFGIKNTAGVSMASTGNTFRVVFFTEEL